MTARTHGMPFQGCLNASHMGRAFINPPLYKCMCKIINYLYDYILPRNVCRRMGTSRSSKDPRKPPGEGSENRISNPMLGTLRYMGKTLPACGIDLSMFLAMGPKSENLTC